MALISISLLNTVRQLRRRVRSPLLMGEQLYRTAKLHHILCSTYFRCTSHASCFPHPSSALSHSQPHQTLALILVICTSALHLYLLARKDHTDFKKALRKGAGSAVVFCMAISVIWPVAALFTYHVRVRCYFLDRWKKIKLNVIYFRGYPF